MSTCARSSVSLGVGGTSSTSPYCTRLYSIVRDKQYNHTAPYSSPSPITGRHPVLNYRIMIITKLLTTKFTSQLATTLPAGSIVHQQHSHRHPVIHGLGRSSCTTAFLIVSNPFTTPPLPNPGPSCPGITNLLSLATVNTKRLECSGLANRHSGHSSVPTGLAVESCQKASDLNKLHGAEWPRHLVRRCRSKMRSPFFWAHQEEARPILSVVDYYLRGMEACRQDDSRP